MIELIRRNIYESFTRTLDEISNISHEAWLKGIFSATNGNISIRLEDRSEYYILITATGSAMRCLQKNDFSLLTAKGNHIDGAQVSSEAPLHLSLYSLKGCNAVMHSHPPYLMAYSLKENVESLFDLPFFEAKAFSKRLGIVKRCEPGSQELALAAKQKAEELLAKNQGTHALWLENHGLVAFGNTLADALTLTEEFEHLAQIALLAKL